MKEHNRILRLFILWGKCLELDTKIVFARNLNELLEYNRQLKEIDLELEKMGYTTEERRAKL